MFRLNEIEWLIEPFHELQTRGIDWRLHSDPATGAKLRADWDSVALNWEEAPTGSAVARVERDLDLDLLDADRLCLRMALPEECRLTLRAVAGGREQTIVERVAGRNRYADYEGPVAGPRLEKLTIEIETSAGGSGEARFLWLIALNGAAHERRHRLARAYDPSWPGLLRPEGVDLEPQLGFLLPDSGIAGLRRRAASPAYGAVWENVRAQATAYLASNPERSVREYLTRYQGASGGRYEHDPGPGVDAADEISSTAMRACALVALVENDSVMARCALRHALAAAHCTHWEDSFMATRPGSLWDHRAFTPMGWMDGFACAIDWAGALLTPAGRDLAARAISFKVLPIVDFSLRKYAYMRANNQAIFFAHTGILAVCTLGRLLPHGGEGLDRYLDLLRQCVSNYVLDDGGTHEGGAYHDDSCSRAVQAFSIAARFRDEPVESLIPGRLLNACRYYRVMAATSYPGGFINTSDGGRVGQRFACGAVPALARLTCDEAVRAMTAALCRPRPDGELPGAIDLLVEGPEKLPEPTVAPPEFEILEETGMLCSCRPTVHGPVRLQLIGAMAGAGHGHEDKGSFVLEAFGDEMLIDRGICHYGDARAGAMKYAWRHNMLTPDDAAGRPMHQVNPLPEAVVPAGRGDEKTLEARIDATPGWLGSLSRCERRIVSDRPTELDLTDIVERGESGTVSVHFQSRFPWVRKGDAWETRGDRAGLTLRPKWDVAGVEASEDLFDGGYTPVYRLTLRTGAGTHFDLRTRIELFPA